jgi:hypothetical protein
MFADPDAWLSCDVNVARMHIHVADKSLWKSAIKLCTKMEKKMGWILVDKDAQEVKSMFAVCKKNFSRDCHVQVIRVGPAC